MHKYLCYYARKKYNHTSRSINMGLHASFYNFNTQYEGNSEIWWHRLGQMHAFLERAVSLNGGSMGDLVLLFLKF